MSKGPSVASIERRILMVRGQRVMLDSDLADLYAVSTKRLNEQVRRNVRRFPADFMFQLSADETAALRSQNATLETGRGKHRKYLPYVFTEQGVAMLSSVLNSERAVQVNIEIMRAFVRLRQLAGVHAGLGRRLDELEKKYDAQFKVVFDAIRALMAAPEPTRRAIGFRVEEGRPAYRQRRRRTAEGGGRKKQQPTSRGLGVQDRNL